jgi:DNA-directed RNA polymerase subunit RPC12/RpoP
MDSRGRFFCQTCGTELSPEASLCPKCGSRLRRVVKVVSEDIQVKESLSMRHKGKGFRRFMLEVIQGWFPSKHPKTSDGVDKLRIIDKERDEYHEVVKDAVSGEIIHEKHEPLSQHRHSSSDAHPPNS